MRKQQIELDAYYKAKEKHRAQQQQRKERYNLDVDLTVLKWELVVALAMFAAVACFAVYKKLTN